MLLGAQTSLRGLCALGCDLFLGYEIETGLRSFYPTLFFSWPVFLSATYCPQGSASVIVQSPPAIDLHFLHNLNISFKSTVISTFLSKSPHFDPAASFLVSVLDFEDNHTFHVLQNEFLSYKTLFLGCWCVISLVFYQTSKSSKSLKGLVDLLLLQKIWRQHCLVITFQHNTDTFAIRYLVLESTDSNS